jgi:hypothetical protein
MIFKGSNNLVQIYRSFSITGNYGRRSFSKYARHKFVTGATLLQLGIPPKLLYFNRMCYGENGTVKFLETLADNVFRHNYSMKYGIDIQIVRPEMTKFKMFR